MAKKPTVSTTFNAVDRMSGPVRRMQQNVKRFSIAVGAGMAAATFAVARSTLKFAEAGDEIAKTSRRVGVTAEALQELRFAAERSGVSSETLTKSLEKLNRNVGDLRVGTGTLTTFLNKSNPALAEQLKNVESNEEAFNLLVNEISSIKNPMDRAALSQAAFGRAGQELITMAENGADGVEALREEARKYGNIVTTEAAEGSEKFVDSLTNLKSAVTAVKNNAIAPLVTAVQPLIQNLADWAAANQDLINQKIQGFIEGITRAAKFLAEQWQNGTIPAILAAVVAFKAIMATIKAFQAVMVIAKAAQIAFNIAVTANPIGLIVAAVAAAVGAIWFYAKNWDKVKIFLGGLWEGIVMSFENAWNRIKAIWEKITGLAKAVGNIIGLGGESTEEGRDFYGGRGAGRPEMRGLVSANQGMNESRSVSESRSTVDINVGGLPQNSTVRQRGQAPGVSLNYGYSQARP